MSTEKWKTVGSKNKSHSGGKKETSAKTTKTTGIQESSSAFSRFGSLQNGEEAGNSVHSSTGRSTTVAAESSSSYSLRGKSSVIGSGSGGGGAESSSSSGGRKKTTAKKSKPQLERVSFEECVRQLDSDALYNFIDEAQSKHSSSPQNLLKEISGYLETAFQRSEVEKDFTFSNYVPGFPLSSLPQSCQEPLLVAVGSCPPLAQESVFRYCIDRLLGEVRTGLPSYGTRIMLQLFIQSNPSTCTEATERIKLLLQSSISKVPEALSLLWVGLPHPELHPFAAAVMGAWPELCLPLLYSSSNVPKQVLAYAVSYTCLLLRHVGGNGGPELLRAVPPQVLSAILTSPQLVGKKNVGNIAELFQLLQESLLGSCPAEQVGSYFSAAFRQMEEQSSQVLLAFTTSCLSRSSSSLRAWERLFPRYPQSSLTLLKQLLLELPPDTSLKHLAHLLNVLVSRASPEEKELAREILSEHATAFINAKSSKSESLSRSGSHSQQLGRGSWCSVCGVLILLLALLYLYGLWLFLYDLASNGPDKYIEKLKVYVDSADVTFASDSMLRALRAVVQLFTHCITTIGSLF